MNGDLRRVVRRECVLTHLQKEGLQKTGGSPRIQFVGLFYLLNWTFVCDRRCATQLRVI